MSETYSTSPAVFRSQPVLYIIMVLLIPMLIGILGLIYLYLDARATKLTVGNSNVSHSFGLFSKDRRECRLSDVRTVRVYQSLINRMFNVGTIEVFTAGDQPEMAVSGIPSPNDFKAAVDQQRA